MDEKNPLTGNTVPELAGYYSCSQEEFERYWSFYIAFSPDYFIE